MADEDRRVGLFLGAAFVLIGLFLVGGIGGKVLVERRRARVRAGLARALGFSYAPPSGGDLFFKEIPRRFALEGLIDHHLVRATADGVRQVELRIGLQTALPGGLRILPDGGRELRTLDAHRIHDVELAAGMVVLSEDPERSKVFLRERDVRRTIARFFESHPSARLLGGEVVVTAPFATEALAVRRLVDHALVLARALEGHVPESQESIVVAGEPEGDAARLGIAIGSAVLEGVAAGMLHSSTGAAAAPDTLGPVGREELRLREAFGRTVTRAWLTGGVLMVGGGLMLVWPVDGSGVGLMGTGFALLLGGAVVYQAQMRCPACRSLLSVWRYLIPSECPRCGARLR